MPNNSRNFCLKKCKKPIWKYPTQCKINWSKRAKECLWIWRECLWITRYVKRWIQKKLIYAAIKPSKSDDIFYFAILYLRICNNQSLPHSCPSSCFKFYNYLKISLPLYGIATALSAALSFIIWFFRVRTWAWLYRFRLARLNFSWDIRESCWACRFPRKVRLMPWWDDL